MTVQTRVGKKSGQIINCKKKKQGAYDIIIFLEKKFKMDDAAFSLSVSILFCMTVKKNLQWPRKVTTRPK